MARIDGWIVIGGKCITGLISGDAMVQNGQIYTTDPFVFLDGITVRTPSHEFELGEPNQQWEAWLAQNNSSIEDFFVL